jgi:hypothetical protein
MAGAQVWERAAHLTSTSRGIHQKNLPFSSDLDAASIHFSP